MVSIKDVKSLLTILILFGVNTSTVFSQDSNVSQKIILLSDHIYNSFQSRKTTTSEKRIAVTDFSAIGNLAKKKNMGNLVAEILISELAKYEAFTLVERMHLEKVLDEQALALSGLIDSETSVQIGNLLGAQAIISGSVIEAGEFFIVNARMVDVESGNVVLTESIEILQADLIALSSKFVVTKKYAMDAAYRSFILPGWGQFYNETPGRGYLYLTASAISVGTAALLKIAG